MACPSLLLQAPLLLLPIPLARALVQTPVLSLLPLELTQLPQPPQQPQQPLLLPARPVTLPPPTTPTTKTQPDTLLVPAVVVPLLWEGEDLRVESPTTPTTITTTVRWKKTRSKRSLHHHHRRVRRSLLRLPPLGADMSRRLFWSRLMKRTSRKDKINKEINNWNIKPAGGFIVVWRISTTCWDDMNCWRLQSWGCPPEGSAKKDEEG